MSLSNIVESISVDIAVQYDNVIEKALEKCGFTKQFCEEHSHEFMWISEQFNPLNKKLYWQNQFLFSIYEVTEYDEKNHKYCIKIEVDFNH